MRTAQQLRARAGQLHGPRVAQKQADAHVVFQALDLPADGGLGPRQLFSGDPEIEGARNRFKGAQLTGRNRP